MITLKGTKNYSSFSRFSGFNNDVEVSDYEIKVSNDFLLNMTNYLTKRKVILGVNYYNGLLDELKTSLHKYIDRL